MRFISKQNSIDNNEPKKVVDSNDELFPGSLEKKPSMGFSAETILKMNRSLFEFGRERALASGDVRVNQDALKSLEDHGEAMAREEGAKLFDPATSRHDQVKEEQRNDAKQEVPDLKTKESLAQEDVRKRRDGLAQCGEITPMPNVPWFYFFLGAFLIGITIAPTINDYFFFDLEDQRQAQYFSVIAGLTAGSVISFGMIGTFKTGRVYHLFGLIAGLLFGVALLLIRLTGADTGSSLQMAVGLSVFELAIVVILDWIGRGLRHQYAKHAEERKEYSILEAYLKAAETELAHWQSEIAARQKIIKDFEAHLFEREHRHAMVENLVRGAKQAVRDGYYQGIAENEGRVRGGKP